MEMVAINKEGDITVGFKKDINFHDSNTPDDQLGDVTTGSKRRKMGNLILKLQTTFSFKYLVGSESENSGAKEEAAIKLQKVYKSYRTRRNLADCAVVCEELWWKSSDSTAFNGCFTSYFDSDKLETASSNWARARTVVAKVGKGLSKDHKAQKLALRHWLEAIDPRHRYGHNLHFYYDVWFESQSSQPFFYWLDVGDGKEVDLRDMCQRKDLQGQCIKYLGPEEREAYEVIVEGGRLVYRQSKDLVHTTEGSKWIFVLSSSRVLYVGRKEKGQFQHSSFLAGGATIASGRLVAHNGVLDVIWPYSGHYRPTEENLMEFICFLEMHNVDMTHVKTHPVDDDVPPSKPVNEELPFEYIEGNMGSSDSATANNHGQENVGHFGNNVEENKPLSSKWATGVGPRICCVRGYPTKLQLQALEQLNLSPRVNHGPIPSPRPSPQFHLSPRIANLGLPSPRVHV